MLAFDHVDVLLANCIRPVSFDRTSICVSPPAGLTIKASFGGATPPVYYTEYHSHRISFFVFFVVVCLGPLAPVGLLALARTAAAHAAAGRVGCFPLVPRWRCCFPWLGVAAAWPSLSAPRPPCLFGWLSVWLVGKATVHRCSELWAHRILAQVKVTQLKSL